METLETNLKIELNKNIYIDFNIEDAVFFDIETTGFTPKNTLLYLIGCIYYDSSNNTFRTKQWFMEEVADEPLIIINFFKFISNYKYLVHYNGNGFDIPYIEKKCLLYNISYDFTNITSFDIYKKILPYKKIFSLENIKQKSIEKFLGIERTDKYTVGDLIAVFYQALKSKNLDYKYKDFLIRHNYDDLLGLIKILPILNYTSVFESLFSLISVTIKNDAAGNPTDVTIRCKTVYPALTRISFGNNSYFVIWENSTISMTVPIYSGGLKFFYPNYKDYYYLPEEDCSIHKSVAFYVDKNYRTKANAANCYSKKTGRFLPQINEIIKPYFKIDYDDKITYFELTQEILDTPELIIKYFLNTITWLVLGNKK